MSGNKEHVRLNKWLAGFTIMIKHSLPSIKSIHSPISGQKIVLFVMDKNMLKLAIDFLKNKTSFGEQNGNLVNIHNISEMLPHFILE